MKFLKLLLVAGLCLLTFSTQAKEPTMTRAQKADKIFTELFATKRTPSPTDPEFMEILQRNIFGETFFIGNLTAKDREMLTVVALTSIQTLPQLKTHIGAALNVGNSPLEIREAIYGCAPFIGFPKTLNAIAVFNEVATERGINLPLEDASTTTEENRYTKGLAIQTKLYGDEVKQAMNSLPQEYQQAVPEMLTNFCFGDFYTRNGLSLRQRELFSLVILTSIGAEKQLPAHIIGALKAGNDKETLLAAMVQITPYVGLPNTLTAINLIKTVDITNYQPIYK